MALSTDLADMMNQTLVAYEYQSFNQYGEATYSTSGSTYSCRIESKPTMVLNSFGEETVASDVVYVNSTASIPLTARIVLADGTEPNIIRSDVQPDLDGSVHHVVLFFGPENG